MKTKHWSEELCDNYRNLNFKYCIRDRRGIGDCLHAGVNSVKEIYDFLEKRYPGILQDKPRIGFSPNKDFSSFLIMNHTEDGKYWVIGHLDIL